jgi:hypothetical protein
MMGTRLRRCPKCDRHDVENCTEPAFTCPMSVSSINRALEAKTPYMEGNQMARLTKAKTWTLVETLATETVETANQLQNALGAMQGSGHEDRNLSGTWVVELVCETTNDGAEAYEIRLRKATRV